MPAARKAAEASPHFSHRVALVPIPSEADEEARRAYREREDLTSERRSIVNKIDGILATLGVKGYKALRRDRREQLNCALFRRPYEYDIHDPDAADNQRNRGGRQEQPGESARRVGSSVKNIGGIFDNKIV